MVKASYLLWVLVFAIEVVVDVPIGWFCLCVLFFFVGTISSKFTKKNEASDISSSVTVVPPSDEAQQTKISQEKADQRPSCHGEYKINVRIDPVTKRQSPSARSHYFSKVNRNSTKSSKRALQKPGTNDKTITHCPAPDGIKPPDIHINIYPESYFMDTLRGAKPLTRSEPAINSPPQAPEPNSLEIENRKWLQQYNQQLLEIKQSFVPKKVKTEEPKRSPGLNEPTKPKSSASVPTEEKKVVPNSSASISVPTETKKEELKSSASRQSGDKVREKLQLPPPIPKTISDIELDLDERKNYFEKLIQITKNNDKPKDLQEPKPLEFNRISARLRIATREILDLWNKNPHSEVYHAYFWTNVCQQFYVTIGRAVGNKVRFLPKIDVIFEMACESEDFARIFYSFLCFKYPHVRGIIPKNTVVSDPKALESNLADVRKILATYFLLLNKSPPDGTKHPFGGMEAAWVWLATVINSDVADSTAFVVDTFLQISGFYMNLFYPTQFPKIISYITKSVIQRMKDYTNKTNPATKGNVVLLQNTLKNQPFTRYEEIIDK